MASHSATKKAKVDCGVDDTICGYLHGVSPVKLAQKSRNKYFHATIQGSREKFRRVVVFAPDKHEVFIRAEKNKSPVKLTNIKKCVSRDGDDFDVQCGRSTDVIITDVDFTVKDPPERLKKSVAEINLMAPKQQVGCFEGLVVHVSETTEMIEFQGRQCEMQSCHVQDYTGNIKVQLWEDQVGCLINGNTYKISNLSTRSFGGNLYLTTTLDTQFNQIAALPGVTCNNTAFSVADTEVLSVIGSISAVVMNVAHKCGKCQMWQTNFDDKVKFHRCQRCGMLQKSLNYQPTANGKMTIDGGGTEYDVSISNSYLKRYLEKCGLLSLLLDHQDLEEHFLDIGQLKFLIQGNAITSVENVCSASVVGQPEVGAGDLEELEEDLEAFFEPAAGRCPEPAAGRCPEPAAGRCPEPAAGRCPEPAAGRCPEPAAGRCPEPAAGRCPETVTEPAGARRPKAAPRRPKASKLE
ncbi:uncharacterized protein LOC130421298 [Triplophysa dalaica]|nr:uncharacterized protein LOC130416999 [Triplophysa dalaica]XP_056605088.1 uncharacterized protein LOC130421298 [Triplophysa dalaica]